MVNFNPYSSFNSTAILLDWSTDVNYPSGNFFYHTDVTNNIISSTGSPSTGVLNHPNVIDGYGTGNGAPYYFSVPGLVINRNKLSTNTTFYVSISGNDSTGTGEFANPFLTIQRAWNVITTCQDLNGWNATIQLGDGTYAGGLVAYNLPVNGAVIIQGNSTTPSNTIVSTTSSDCFYVANGVNLTVRNVKLQTATGGACLHASRGATITYNGVNFGACANVHTLADTNIRGYSGYTKAIIYHHG